LRGLYGIVDLAGWGQADGALERQLATLLAARVGVVQLRAKSMSSAQILEVARKVRAATAAVGVRFCINDRVDLALAAGADLVHLGQDDLPLGPARAWAGNRLGYGISTHSFAQAVAAAVGGADYVGFGPVFPTRSKANPDPVQGLAALAEVVQAVRPLPVVAIGGITPENAALVAATGACAAAAIASIHGGPDPIAAACAIAAPFGQ
jgi:thiamine-phosphate pyrophosphorylase